MVVVVELVGNICNSKCKWCFHNYKTSEYIPSGYMRPDGFKKFIDINRGFVGGIHPFSHGESLIHPNWTSMIQYALDRGCRMVGIHTNFAMELTNKHINLLGRFRSVTVNIGGIDRETHHLNTGTNLDTVVANLKRLCEVRNRIDVKMVINKNNVNQKEDIEQWAKDISPKLHTSTFPVYLATSDSSQEDIREWIENNISPEVKCRDEIKMEGDNYIITPKISKCPDKTITVRHRGEVQLCCRSRRPEGIAGDAFTTPMQRILSSPKVQKMLASRDKREYISYCKVCS